MSAAITATDLRRTFGENEAVAGVDLDVEPGEIYGFLGPNGAGKSTMVKMLCTLSSPTSGVATVAGYDVEQDAAAIRLRIGVALQDASIDGKQTGREMLDLQGRLYGLSKANIAKRMDDVIGLVNIGAAIDDRVETYSGGMKRRLDLAMSLIHKPRQIQGVNAPDDLRLPGLAAMRMNVRCDVMNEQDQSIWDQYRRGRSAREIGRGLEVSHRMVQNRLNKHGGIKPAERRRGVGRLSFDDREEISRGIAAGLSANSIASAMDRPASTISREIARNGGRDAYRAVDAEQAAWDRALRPKPTKLAGHAVLCGDVVEGLANKWSPEQIAGRLVVD